MYITLPTFSIISHTYNFFKVIYAHHCFIPAFKPTLPISYTTQRNYIASSHHLRSQLLIAYPLIAPSKHPSNHFTPHHQQPQPVASNPLTPSHFGPAFSSDNAGDGPPTPFSLRPSKFNSLKHPSYSTMSSRKLQKIITTSMHKILDIALLLQLGQTTLNRSYKKLQKPLLLLYTITSQLSPQASYWDILKTLHNYIITTIIATLPHFSMDPTLYTLVSNTIRDILVTTTSAYLPHTQPHHNPRTHTYPQPPPHLLLPLPLSSTPNLLLLSSPSPPTLHPQPLSTQSPYHLLHLPLSPLPPFPIKQDAL